MKRTPLKRKTPLRSGHGGLRRTTLRAKPRPAEDKVDPRERRHVLLRDGECIARKCIRLGLVPDNHVCRDALGNPLPAMPDPMTLSLEHVKEAAQVGGNRAPSTRRWMVAACYHANNGDYWVSKYRSYIRLYLEWLDSKGAL